MSAAHAGFAVDRDALARVVDAGGVALCANARLQRAVAEALGERGAEAVALARAQTLGQWLERRWRDWLLGAGGDSAPADCLLCDASREEMAWQQLLSRRDDVPARAAAPAARAERALRLHRLAMQDARVESAFLAERESRQFFEWRAEWADYCAQRRLLPELSAAEILIDAFASGRLARHPGIALVGFRPLAPLHRALVEAATERLVALEPMQAEAPVRVVECADAAGELASAARWAAERLAADPVARVAVAVPELHRRRREVDYVFGSALADARLGAGDAVGYRVSAGEPLADTPLVSAALRALRCNVWPLAMSDVESLARSPFFAPDEAAASPAWLAGLRALRRERLERDEVARLGRARCPAPFSALLSFGEPTPQRLGLADWSARFAAQLERAGWPGRRALDSVEYQQRERWDALLAELAVRDAVCAPMGVDAALGAVQALAARDVFQPQRPDEGALRLEVLDPTGGVGMRFDALWMAGMTDRDWPPPVSPYAFIPLQLQREAGMEEADATLRLAAAKHLLAEHRRSAAALWCSYARRDAEGPLRASPLLSVDWTRDGDAAHAWRPAWSLVASGPFERVDCGDAPACEASERVGVPSGALKMQSDCPFQAWAFRRLGVRESEAPTSGLDARQRGSMVHWALESLWEGFEDSGELLADEAAWREAVERASAEAASRMRERAPASLGERFWRIERARLAEWLTRWVERAERDAHQREPFAVVAREQAFGGQLGGLEFSLRADRVDELPDGRLRLVDYKTGRPESDSWDGERPAEPQLPLYAELYDGPVGAIAYGLLRADEACYREKTWDEVWYQERLESRNAVTRLAGEYAAGRCAVAPRKPAVCRLCALPRLCRVGAPLDDG